MTLELALSLLSGAFRPIVVHAWPTGSARGLGAARTGQLLVRQLTAYVCRAAGPVLIISISGSCGFVLGATLAHPY